MQRRNRFAMTESSTPLEARVLLAANQIKSFDHTIAIKDHLPQYLQGYVGLESFLDVRIKIDRSQILTNNPQAVPKIAEDVAEDTLREIQREINQIQVNGELYLDVGEYGFYGKEYEAPPEVDEIIFNNGGQIPAEWVVYEYDKGDIVNAIEAGVKEVANRHAVVKNIKILGFHD